MSSAEVSANKVRGAAVATLRQIISIIFYRAATEIKSTVSSISTSTKESTSTSTSTKESTSTNTAAINPSGNAWWVTTPPPLHYS